MRLFYILCECEQQEKKRCFPHTHTYTPKLDSNTKANKFTFAKSTNNPQEKKAKNNYFQQTAYKHIVQSAPGDRYTAILCLIFQNLVQSNKVPTTINVTQCNHCCQSQTKGKRMTKFIHDWVKWKEWRKKEEEEWT